MKVTPIISICYLMLSCQGYATDLVFSANQNSNTVSVISATKNTNIGDIILGYPNGDNRLLSPLYNGHINVHGLAYSPVKKELAVISTVTNSLITIETDTLKIRNTVFLGRNPHEPRYTHDGKEIWVTVRGENYISVIDVATGKEVSRVILSEGPGMVAFSHDGKLAFVSSSFDNNFWVIEVQSKNIIKQITLESKFSPFITTTPDGREVWVGHKDIGKVTRIDTKSLEIIETFTTGKISNHLAFGNGKAYVTVGGENSIHIYNFKNKENAFLIKKIDAGNLPHGIWNSDSGNEIYFVNELDDTLQVIDTKIDRIIKSLNVGKLPQALVYAVRASDKSDRDLAEILKNQKMIFKGPQKP